MDKMKGLEALNDIDYYVNNNMITRRKHPDYNLWILNYTPKVQYNPDLWDDTTMICRGLIVDFEYNPIACPFPKFFNFGEFHEKDIPNEDFTIQPKLDGSLGIAYMSPDGVKIATRGSFTSEQSARANEMLNTIYKANLAEIEADVTQGLTPLFEIIYPENKIVVDYQGESKLVLLGIIDNKKWINDPFNAEIKDIERFAKRYGMGYAKPRQHTKNNLDILFNLDDHSLRGMEGYVVTFESGFKVKIKGQWYVDLHKVIFGFSFQRVLNEVIEGNQYNYVDILPDELHSKFREWLHYITFTYDKIKAHIDNMFDIAPKETRKDYALWVSKNIKNNRIKPLMFKRLDGNLKNSDILRLIEEPKND